MNSFAPFEIETKFQDIISENNGDCRLYDSETVDKLHTNYVEVTSEVNCMSNWIRTSSSKGDGQGKPED